MIIGREQDIGTGT